MSFKREVPQFIDIEDKLAFQLTAKQLGWVGLGFFFGFWAWYFLEDFYFAITALFIVVLVVGILFFKPYGLTLPSFIGNAFLFLIKPKVYIWKRGSYKLSKQKEETKEEIVKLKKEPKKMEIREIKEAIKKINIYD
jgi:hypothetical protein